MLGSYCLLNAMRWCARLTVPRWIDNAAVRDAVRNAGGSFAPLPRTNDVVASVPAADAAVEGAG